MKKGFSLISTLVLGTVAILVVSGLITFANQNLRAERRAIESEKAFRAAEAGVEYFRWLLSSGGDVTNETTFDYRDQNDAVIGRYTLTESPTLDGVTLISRGVNGSAVRTIKADFIQGEGANFQYGVQAGNGSFQLDNNSTIVGNVYSNGNIRGKSGSSITGDAFAVGTVSGVDVGGETQTGVSPIDLPITAEMITGWKDDAGANVRNGSQTISGDNNVLGPVKIVGDLKVEKNARLLISDTVWVTGNILLDDSSIVSLSSSYGENGGVIIADGAITLVGKSVQNGSGQEGSYLMLVSTSSSDEAISIGNNASSVILFAPNGTVSLKNNINITAVAAKTVYVNNNSTINYKQEVIANFKSGPSGGWQMQNWREVPNN